MRISRRLLALSGLVATIAGSAAQVARARELPQQPLPEITVRAPAPVPPLPRDPRLAVDWLLQGPWPNGPPPTLTTAGPVSGYRALTAISSTKTETPIERIPQTIQIVPRTVIDDQVSLTQSEAIRNVAGAAGVPPTVLNGVGYKVRGFDAERYVDGLPNYIDAGDHTSLVNTERIEVVKGPGGLFFQSGVGMTGGVINTISKLPGAAPSYRAGFIGGGQGLRNPWFDVNRPLGSGVLFRMTGEFEQARHFIDVIERGRFSLNPTLAFVKDGTSLTVQGRISRRDHQVYVGLPATGSLDRSLFTLRRDLFVGPPDLPKSTSETLGVTARLEHEIDSVWSLRSAARFSEIRYRDRAQSYLSHAPDLGTSFVMFNLGTPWDAREVSANADLIGRFTVGETRNTLLFTADYNRVADSLAIWSSPAGLTDFAVPAPMFPAYRDPIGTGTITFEADNVNINSGVAAQLQTTVWDRLHLVAGARWAHVDFLGSQPFGSGRYHSVESKVLPRFGVAFDLVAGVTPFAGYSEGLRAVRFFGGQGTPKPEEAEQIEAGVKLALPYGISATLAAFDITRRNVVSSAPGNPLLQVQTGELRSRGFDAAVVWQPLPGLSMLASYAHIDARLTQDAVLQPGNRLDRVPADSGRLWLQYKFQDGWLRGVSVGAGLYAASRQAIGLDNRFFTPAYATLDARIGYDAETWSVGIVGKNLTNSRHFEPYPYAQGRVAPAEPLTVLGFATLKH